MWESVCPDISRAPTFILFFGFWGVVWESVCPDASRAPTLVLFYGFWGGVRESVCPGDSRAPTLVLSMGSGGSCGSRCVLTLVGLPLSCLFVFSGCLYAYQDIKVRGVHVQVSPLTPSRFSSYTSSSSPSLCELQELTADYLDTLATSWGINHFKNSAGSLVSDVFSYTRLSLIAYFTDSFSDYFLLQVVIFCSCSLHLAWVACRGEGPLSMSCPCPFWSFFFVCELESSS